MTDKEIIIIDGVDVSECIFLDIVNERIWCDNVNISAIGKSQCPYVDCFKNPDCYYKQLARKTQECEELKKELNGSEKWRVKSESLNEKLDIENTRYRKALEEIEEVINNILNSCLGRNTVGCRPAHNVCGDLIKIHDIINKAKGGK